MANLDKPNLLTKDLWVDSEEWEAQTFKCFQAKSDKKSVGEEDDDDDDEDDEEYEAQEESDRDDFDESEFFDSLYKMF